jgi:hypothetical protein
VGFIVGLRVEVMEGRGVRVRVLVRLGVKVAEGVGLGSGVGGSPSTVKRPDTFQSRPTKIWTSYSPGIHSEGSGAQSV